MLLQQTNSYGRNSSCDDETEAENLDKEGEKHVTVLQKDLEQED